MKTEERRTTMGVVVGDIGFVLADGFVLGS